MRATSLDSKLIGTVHDSIVIDSPEHEIDTVVNMIQAVWKDLPLNFERLFRSNFNLPCKVEISVGRDWHNMTELEIK
jgi:DNA polymerase I-like protein with 3'-5' exonuclease and polymerase domains